MNDIAMFGIKMDEVVIEQNDVFILRIMDERKLVKRPRSIAILSQAAQLSDQPSSSIQRP